MTARNAAIQILLLLTFAWSAAAQWIDPFRSGNLRSNGQNNDSFLPNSFDGDPSERARTVFERAERNAARISFPSETEPVSAPGTVSVAQLRHHMSRAGADLIKRAQKYATQGKHLQAIEVLNQALQENSSVADATGLLGVEYLKLGDLQAAITHLKQAVVLMPWLAANHSNLGFALCLAGDTAGGEVEIREAIKADSTLPKTHFLLGVILLDRATPEAREELLLAENQVSTAHLALAVYHVRRGDTEAAQAELKAFVRKNRSVDSTGITRWVAEAAALITPASAFGFHPQASPSYEGSVADLTEVGLRR